MKRGEGTSLVAQWLKLCAPTTGCMGSIPGWGTKIPQARQPKKKKKRGGGEFRALSLPVQRRGRVNSLQTVRK